MNVDVHFGGDLCHLHHGESRCHGHDQVTRPCLFMAAVGYHKLSAGCQLPLPRQGLYSARAWMDFKSCLRPQSRPQTNFDVCGNKEPLRSLSDRPEPSSMPRLVSTILRSLQRIHSTSAQLRELGPSATTIWAVEAMVRNTAAPATQESAEGSNRLPGGGPTGKAPLIRALRAKQPDVRKVAGAWLDRFASDRHAAVAELLQLILVVADLPSQTTIDREPSEVVTELTASLALEASERGADYTQHWLVSREKGAQRVRENYPAIWRELVLAPPVDVLVVSSNEMSRESYRGNEVHDAQAWTQAFSECQFRSIRHASVVAGLALVEGVSEQCSHQSEWVKTAETRVKELRGAPLASLKAELDHTRSALQSLQTARDSLAETLLSRRSKDILHGL
eukprot:s1500_g2.t1